jgi:hypothetical protein
MLAGDFSAQAQPAQASVRQAVGPAGARQDAQSAADARAQATFAGVLSRLSKAPAQNEAELKERARDAAEDFIAMSLVQPILSHMREHPLVDPEQMGPLAPGVGEKTLQPLWDAQAAREIVRASNWPMVDQLATQLLKKAGVVTSNAGKEVDRHA